MSKIDEFKEFVRKNPSLISQVKNNNMTWQQFYEFYDLYGEDKNIWNNYIRSNNVENNSNTKSTSSSLTEIINMAKNMDVNKVQEGIVSLQKAIGLVSDLFVKDNSNKTSEYKPRPLYKHFED